MFAVLELSDYVIIACIVILFAGGVRVATGLSPRSDGAGLRRLEGKIDLILDFALQLPIIVICEMIGYPPKDRVELKKWADAVGNVIVLGSTIRHEVEARHAMIAMREAVFMM